MSYFKRMSGDILPCNPQMGSKNQVNSTGASESLCPRDSSMQGTRYEARVCGLSAACRAMVELHKALEENEVCRSPLLDGHHEKKEVSSSVRTDNKHQHCLLHHVHPCSTSISAYLCHSPLYEHLMSCKLFTSIAGQLHV